MSEELIGVGVLVLVLAVAAWLGYYHRSDTHEGPDDKMEW